MLNHGAINDFKGYRLNKKTNTEDLQAIVDHLVVVGSHRKHQDWRYRRWRRSKRQPVVELATTTKATGSFLPPSDSPILDTCLENNTRPTEPTISGTLKKPRTAINKFDSSQIRFLHAQDTRIYGISSDQTVEAQPWPRQIRTAKIYAVHASDKIWDQEYSDGIHPIAFSMNRLTIRSPIQSLDELTRYGTIDLETNLPDNPHAINKDIKYHEAPRAILLHCWERAMHAVSSVVEVTPFAIDEGNNNDHGQNPSPSVGQVDYQSNPSISDDLSPEMAQDKCRRLNIHLDAKRGQGPHPNINCPVCTSIFDTIDQLNDHFFATRPGSNKASACCHYLLEKERRKLVDRVLQEEVQLQTRGLLQLLTDELKLNDERMKRQEIPYVTQIANAAETTTAAVAAAVGKKRKFAQKLFNWHDVIQVLESKLQVLGSKSNDASSPCDDQHRSSNIMLRQATETLEVRRDVLPLPLNPVLINSVKRRLVERYAKVAR